MRRVHALQALIQRACGLGLFKHLPNFGHRPLRAGARRDAFFGVPDADGALSDFVGAGDGVNGPASAEGGDAGGALVSPLGDEAGVLGYGGFTWMGGHGLKLNGVMGVIEHAAGERIAHLVCPPFAGFIGRGDARLLAAIDPVVKAKKRLLV